MIALLSKKHRESLRPDHWSSKKLIDVADVVMDNEAPPVDRTQRFLAWNGLRVLFSTLTGAMVINIWRSATAEKLIERGISRVIFVEPALDRMQRPEDALEEFYEAYRMSLA